MEFPPRIRTKKTAKKSSGGWPPRKQAPFTKMGPVSSSSGLSSNSSPSSSSSSSQSSFLMSWSSEEEELPQTSSIPFSKPLKRFKITPGRAPRKRLAQSLFTLHAVEDDGTESEEKSDEEYDKTEKPFYLGTDGNILEMYDPIVQIQDFQFANKFDEMEKPFYIGANGKLHEKFDPTVRIQDFLKMDSA